MENDQNKIVVLSAAGKIRVHNETTPTMRSYGGQLDCSKTQVVANDTSY